jgi:hypothetical protein
MIVLGYHASVLLAYLVVRCWFVGCASVMLHGERWIADVDQSILAEQLQHLSIRPSILS